MDGVRSEAPPPTSEKPRLRAFLPLVIVALTQTAWSTVAARGIGGATVVPRGRAVTARLSRTLTLPRDGRIAIEATVGEVTVEAWDRPDTTIEIVRSAPSAADLEKVPATIEVSGATATIRAVQANDGLDPALRTTISIRTPAEIAIDALELFEGRVVLKDLTRAVRASLKRGRLEAAGLAGTVRLETSIGDVTLHDAGLTPGGLIRLRAFNGHVRLHLASAPADARILAMTFNGTIRSAVPLTMKTAFGPRFGEATIGRGEPVVSIDVVTGDIVIEVGKNEQGSWLETQG